MFLGSFWIDGGDMRNLDLLRPPAGGRQAGALQAVLAMLITTLPLLSFAALPPAMPRLVQHFAGAPRVTLLAPMIATAPAVCIALLAPFAGALAGYIGRRRLILWSLPLFLAAGLIPLAVDDIGLIIASRLIMGVADAALLTVGTTLIADYFSGDARRRWLAISGAASPLLTCLVTLIGGLLAELSWRGPFWVCLATAPVFVAAVLGLYEPGTAPPLPKGEGRDLAFAPGALAVLSLATAALAMLYYVAPIQIGLMLDGLGMKSPGRIALLSAAASVGYPIGAALFGRVGGRWPQKALASFALSLFALGLIGMGLTSATLGIGLSAFVLQIGAGLALNLTIFQCFERSAYRWRALSTGVWVSSYFAGQFVSPLAVALLGSAAGGPRDGVAVLGVITAAAAVAGWAWPRRTAVLGAS